MAEHGRLLVVDDDPDVREAVSRALRLQGYEVFTAADGGQALAAVTEVHPEALVLDVLMPFVDGLEVCRQLRARRDRSPILVLTARDGVADRIAGLDAGADDYLVKPFALGELLARVRALLRRVRLEDPDTLRFGDLTLDPESRQARRGSRVIDLTHTEYTLLELFVQNAGAVLTHEVILDRIWGHRFSPETNSLQVFIHYLRRKTEAGGEPRLVHTVRGLGYTLREA